MAKTNTTTEQHINGKIGDDIINGKALSQQLWHNFASGVSSSLHAHYKNVSTRSVFSRSRDPPAVVVELKPYDNTVIIFFFY